MRKHHTALQAIKEALITKLLSFSNKTFFTQVTEDASPVGLGRCWQKSIQTIRKINI
jgi:hypothetical protein